MAEMCVREGDYLVIRIPVNTLAQAVEAGPHGGWMRVTDADVFADELVFRLNDEEEDGTTRVHRLLDEACEAVGENGGDGCEEVVPEGDDHA